MFGLLAPQESFALKILAAGKPCVVVLINGGALSIDSLVDPAPAIIEGFYPGFNGAQVLTSAIFGDVNEFGRLPYTIYPSAYASQVDMNNMSMQVGVQRVVGDGGGWWVRVVFGVVVWEEQAMCETACMWQCEWLGCVCVCVWCVCWTQAGPGRTYRYYTGEGDECLVGGRDVCRRCKVCIGAGWM